jgi:hypothetical protein
MFCHDLLGPMAMADRNDFDRNISVIIRVPYKTTTLTHKNQNERGHNRQAKSHFKKKILQLNWS